MTTPHTFRAFRSCLLLLIFPVLFMQAYGRGTTGILEGIVRDRVTRTALVGANILILSTPYGAPSDVDGKFLIHNIPTGTYTLRVQMLGYKSLVMQNVEIRSDLRTRIVADLDVSTIGMEEVIVRAERPLIEKDITGTTHRVGGEELDLLPITSFADVLGLQAGTTMEGNVRGGKTTEVAYLIDGLPVQDLLSGGLSSNLPNSTIVDLTLQTGGFDAEYGNALSGVVNVVTKSGGNNHDLAVHVEKDDAFGGTEHSKNNEFELTASGPILRDRIFYFISGNYDLTGTQWWQDFERSLTEPIDKSFNGFAKIDLFLSPTIRWSNQALVSMHDWHDYEFSWRFNLQGLPTRDKLTYRIASVLSHTISDKSFYTIRLSTHRMENTVGGTARPSINPLEIYQYDFFLQYITSGNRALWSKTLQTVYTAKVDFASQVDDINLLKAGIELNFYDINTDIEKYEPRKTYFGKPLVNLPQLNYSTQYRYFPKSGSAYIQDKIEMDAGAIISVGIRYDFLDPTASRPAIDRIPVKQNEYLTQVTGYTKASVKQQFSPRIGFAMPVTPTAMLFVNYGHYFQFPLFDYLYSGLDVVALQRGASAVLGNPDLEPERTQAWEISIRQIMNDEFVGSATYFKKSTTNQVDSKTFIPMDSKAAGDFGFAEYVNNPHADAQGLELVLTRTRGAWITGEISYTYMKTEGLSDRASQGLDLAQWGFQPYISLFPMSWDQRHTVKVNALVQLPFNIQANVIFNYYSARPYTYYPSRDGFTPLYPTAVFIPNNRRMEDYINTDVKISKEIELGFSRYSRLLVYADIRNLFDALNVRWMDASGRIGGELGDPSAYFIPRRSRIGVRLTVGL